MTDIEKAIQEFEDNAYHESLKPDISIESKAVALRALLDKQEREQGCEYCCDYTLNDSQFYDVEGEMGARFNFCPMCGRRLKE